MRGIPSLITEIRKKVFTEVARMAYEGGYSRADELPYIIVPGDQPLHRESIFLERAIASEQVRLAMGLSLRPVRDDEVTKEGREITPAFFDKRHNLPENGNTTDDRLTAGLQGGDRRLLYQKGEHDDS